MSDDKRPDLAEKIANAVYQSIEDTLRGYASEYSDDPERCIAEDRADILEAIKKVLDER